MAMTVQRRKDNQTPRVFVHKIADVRGGVSVKASELGSDYLPEGAVLSAPEKGLCHVVKVGEVSAAVADTDTAIKIKKGHQFKKGDHILAAVSGKSVTITDIDESEKAFAKLAISEAIGAISLGGFVVEAKEKVASGAALKYTPFAVVGTGKAVDPKSNLDVDAWVIGVTKGNNLPSFISDKLKGIINY